MIKCFQALLLFLKPALNVSAREKILARTVTIQVLVNNQYRNLLIVFFTKSGVKAFTPNVYQKLSNTAILNLFVTFPMLKVLLRLLKG